MALIVPDVAAVRVCGYTHRTTPARRAAGRRAFTTRRNKAVSQKAMGFCATRDFGESVFLPTELLEAKAGSHRTWGTW